MTRLLVVLAPPRSFASVVPAMLGQHPQAYGFPDLQLLLRETVGELLEWSGSLGRPLGPPGLLRAVAELVFGAQTPQAVLSAALWVEDRAAEPGRAVMAELMERARERTGARLCIHKAPALPFMSDALDRLREAFPDALYLHLTRHPAALGDSLAALADSVPGEDEADRAARRRGAMLAWPYTQRNILDFCATLLPGQALRLRGEDLLESPATYLPQVALWAGLDAGPTAIAAMMRPEEGPFSRPGPFNAAGGHDARYLASPTLRPGRPPARPLVGALAEGGLDAARRDYLAQLAACLGYA